MQNFVQETWFRFSIKFSANIIELKICGSLSSVLKLWAWLIFLKLNFFFLLIIFTCFRVINTLKLQFSSIEYYDDSYWHPLSPQSLRVMACLHWKTQPLDVIIFVEEELQGTSVLPTRTVTFHLLMLLPNAVQVDYFSMHMFYLLLQFEKVVSSTLRK